MRKKKRKPRYRILGYVRTVPWETFCGFGVPILERQIEYIERVARIRYKKCDLSFFIDTQEVLDVADSMMFMRLLKEAIADENTFVMVLDTTIIQTTFLIGKYPIVRARRLKGEKSYVERMVDFCGDPLTPDVTYRPRERSHCDPPPDSLHEPDSPTAQSPSD